MRWHLVDKQNATSSPLRCVGCQRRNYLGCNVKRFPCSCGGRWYGRLRGDAINAGITSAKLACSLTPPRDVPAMISTPSVKDFADISHLFSSTSNVLLPLCKFLVVCPGATHSTRSNHYTHLLRINHTRCFPPPLSSSPSLLRLLPMSS